MGKVLALITVLALNVTAFSAVAHDHPSAKITGTEIQLFERNHAFAGSILDIPVFGAFDHVPYGGKIQLRKGEKTLELAFVDSQTEYKGTLTETVTDEKTGVVSTIETAVIFGKVEKTGTKSGNITLNIDGTDVVVAVSGKKFENNHFHSPTFTATLNGKKIKFKLKGGEACFGYSSNISMMVLGAYAHLMK